MFFQVFITEKGQVKASHTTQKQLWHFGGIYRWFIRNFSKVVLPLASLNSPKVLIEHPAHHTFDFLKEFCSLTSFLVSIRRQSERAKLGAVWYRTVGPPETHNWWNSKISTATGLSQSIPQLPAPMFPSQDCEFSVYWSLPSLLFLAMESIPCTITKNTLPPYSSTYLLSRWESLSKVINYKLSLKTVSCLH